MSKGLWLAIVFVIGIASAGCTTTESPECTAARTQYEIEQASRAREIEIAEARYAERYAVYQRHKLDNPFDVSAKPPYRPAQPPPFALNAARAEIEAACG